MHSIPGLEQKLGAWFRLHPKVVVALSGGVDSCLVAYLSRKFLGKKNSIAVISASASVKQKDLDVARKFSVLYDIQLIETDAGEIRDPNYTKNPINRCFYCKSALYAKLKKIVDLHYPSFEVINGNNFSDLGDYRPGLKAAENFSALSPLAECGLDKNDIRKLAKHYKLFVWDKPASPCLSSRFPYGESISKEKLKQIERSEDLLNSFGFDDVRVRYIKNIAKIEVPNEQIKKLQDKISAISSEFKKFGFENCVIDQEGLISGKLNRNIKNSV
ncbi:MAG: ATP-dependent sacrificial sulfur transferase LarE [Bacteroidales bacterium]|nr:ATP-dependent sacrificial sulfur transferase LarE [Bacteroidales bacterium]